MIPLLSILPLLILYIVNTIINGAMITTTLADHHPLQKGNETDRNALLNIKSMITQDPLGVLNSWNASSHFCMWEGVICGTRHKRVTTLNLSSSNMVGSLSPFIGNLSFLRFLCLYNNSFSGHIPPEIGRLFRLEKLGLINNSFQGEIPTNISSCTQLNFLQLGYNKLIGKIPFGFRFLSQLKFLSVAGNNLTGDDLSPLANLTSLRILGLSDQNSQGGSGFSGRIPDFIGNFKGLTELDLGGNSFSGEIPPSLYNLSNLQTFSLAGNLLEGVLPSNIGLYFPQLQQLQLYENYFSGPIPLSLSNLTMLEHLDFSYNNFTGKFLFDARKMPNLMFLIIGNAVMGRGDLDELDFLNTLLNCTYLQSLDSSGNNMGGHLPHLIANLSNLRGLSLEYNLISGSIPSGLSSLLNLEFLLLNSNQLTGNIPTNIGKIPRLQILHLSINQLTGSVPLALGNLSWLSYLILGSNKFQGRVPNTLGNCNNLLALDLSQNNLVGNIPPSIFQALMLVEVYLSENNLQGSVPSEIGNLQNIGQIDMSGNNLSDNIPNSLGQCLYLQVLDLQGNSFNGFIPPSFNDLKSLEFVDLSDNKLSGQVPKYFSNFSYLTYLNLSFNNLEGDVPTKGIFANTSAFFFTGNNKLCGGILQLELPSCPIIKSKIENKSHTRITIALTISCFLVGLIVVSFVYLTFTKRKREHSLSSSETTIKEPFIKVSYDMLLKATNGFSPTNLIGSGTFSSVFKGTLLINGTQKSVAIKVINNQHQGATQSFLAECEAFRVIRHRNLVGVITACSSIDFQGNVFNAIVYDLMENGSLERWLYLNPEDNDHQFQSLRLLQRLNISIDVAHALDYIHNVCKSPFVHCDLKATNILLDNDLTARVGDFGLVKLPPEITNGIPNYNTLGVRGTVGYIAPEYGFGASISAMGDVYSYGILLLELMTAKKPTDVRFEGELSLHKFAESSLPDNVQEILDPKLNVHGDEIDLNNGRVITKCAFECIRTMIMIGVRCSSEVPEDRMDIKDVIRQLESQRGILRQCGRGHRCQLIT